jgi:hypothetical protein
MEARKLSPQPQLSKNLCNVVDIGNMSIIQQKWPSI